MNTQATQYAELKRLIASAGLLEKHPLRYYGPRAAAIAAMLACCVVGIAVADSLWLLLACAGFLAFITVQIKFLGHDLGHSQVFRRAKHNEAASIVVSALLGVNRSWWVDKHNQHHANPNYVDLDPDLDFPVIAFTVESAAAKPWLARQIVKRQAWVFYPLTCLEALVLKFSGLHHLLRAYWSMGRKGRRGEVTRIGRLSYPVAEGLALLTHFAVYLGLLFTYLSVWEAITFIAVHQALTGLYVSATFAPNHKGMTVVEIGHSLGVVEAQTATARNITPTAVTDYIYGGLNYQIEHHLFPNMPRNSLKRARAIIKPYCAARGYAYYETGALRSQREIVSHLNQVGKSLQGRPAAA